MPRALVGSAVLVLGLGQFASSGQDSREADLYARYSKRPAKGVSCVKDGKPCTDPATEARITAAGGGAPPSLTLEGEPTPEELLEAAKTLANEAGIAVECATATDRSSATAQQTCTEASSWIKDEITHNRAELLAGTNPLQNALLEARLRVTYLKKWVGAYEKRYRRAGLQGAESEAQDAVKKQGDTLVALKTQVNNVRSNLSAGMVAEGLRETFTAEIVSGAFFGRTQSEPSGSTQTTPPVYLHIKSRPFGAGYDQDRTQELRLGVRFGLVPTLSLVKPAPQASPSPSPTPAAATAKEQDPAATDTLNTIFEVRADLARSLGDASDLGVTVAGGQIWSNADQVQRKLDGKDALFVTLPGKKGRDAIFFEAGLRFRYFDDIPRGARAEQPSIEPRIELSAVYRHDPRLNVEAGALTFDSPEDRLVARLMLSGIPLVGKNDAAGKPVHIGIGIEHERGFGHNPIPSVTRIFVRGDVDLLKSLSGTK